MLKWEAEAADSRQKASEMRSALAREILLKLNRISQKDAEKACRSKAAAKSSAETSAAPPLGTLLLSPSAKVRPRLSAAKVLQSKVEDHFRGMPMPEWPSQVISKQYLIDQCDECSYFGHVMKCPDSKGISYCPYCWHCLLLLLPPASVTPSPMRCWASSWS